MAAAWHSLCSVFWSSDFWLPTGFTWKDLQTNSTDVYYPRVEDMNWSFAIGFLMLLVRFVYERVLVEPAAKALGVRDKRRPVPPNPVLEKAYDDHRGKARKEDLELLTKKTELTERQIQRWFRKRRQKDATSGLTKFKESSWHFLFYFSAFVYGVYTFWNREWFWDIKHCFQGWPNHPVETPLYILCVAEIGFYWSLLFSAFTDPKRLDFWEMTIHHVITIGLIYFSWVINFVRIGALIIVTHDVADYWLAAAKMAKYGKRQTLCEVLFACFLVFWLVTRMYLYPFWILKSIIYVLPEHVPEFVSLRFFMLALCILQVLHIFWTYLILKMAFQKFTRGSLEKDVRSDESEDDLSDSEVESPTKYMNGTKTIASRNNNVG